MKKSHFLTPSSPHPSQLSRNQGPLPIITSISTSSLFQSTTLPSWAVAVERLAPVPVPRVVLATTPVPARDAEYVTPLGENRIIKLTAVCAISRSKPCGRGSIPSHWLRAKVYHQRFGATVELDVSRDTMLSYLSLPQLALYFVLSLKYSKC